VGVVIDQSGADGKLVGGKLLKLLLGKLGGGGGGGGGRERERERKK
jgi:hypothetical protein